MLEVQAQGQGQSTPAASSNQLPLASLTGQRIMIEAECSLRLSKKLQKSLGGDPPPVLSSQISFADSMVLGIVHHGRHQLPVWREVCIMARFLYDRLASDEELLTS